MTTSGHRQRPISRRAHSRRRRDEVLGPVEAAVGSRRRRAAGACAGRARRRAIRSGITRDVRPADLHGKAARCSTTPGVASITRSHSCAAGCIWCGSKHRSSRDPCSWSPHPVGCTRIGIATYAGCLSGLFGVSALYHRGNWGPVASRMLQRADHLMIFLLIAGTATPVFLLAVPGPYGLVCLIVLWSLTAVATGAHLTRMRGTRMARRRNLRRARSRQHTRAACAVGQRRCGRRASS